MKTIEQIAREIVSTVPKKRLEILMEVPAYRGERYATKEYQVGAYPKNRMPKDNSRIMQAKFDHVLKSMGFKALRSNSIFVTGSRTMASAYASNNPLGVRVIIPAGKMYITWSTSIRDLMFYNLVIAYKDVLVFDWDCMERNFKDRQPLVKIVKDAIRYQPSLKGLIENLCGGVSLDKCLNRADFEKLYRIMRVHSSLFGDFFNEILTSSIGKSIAPCYTLDPNNRIFATMRNSDLRSALLSGNEILVTGDFYYSVEEDFFVEELLPILKEMLQ